jgi:hypothetical protein
MYQQTIARGYCHIESKLKGREEGRESTVKVRRGIHCRRSYEMKIMPPVLEVLTHAVHGNVFGLKGQVKNTSNQPSVYEWAKPALGYEMSNIAMKPYFGFTDIN